MWFSPRSRRLVVCVAIVVASGASAAARARAVQPFSSASVPVVVSELAAYQGGDTPVPALALGPQGRELAVYTGASEAVLARVLDSSGRPVGSQAVVWSGADRIGSPAVAWVARSQRFLVAWSTAHGTCDAGSVMLRAVSARGRPLGPVRLVSSTAGDESVSDPALVTGPGHSELLAWAWDRVGNQCQESPTQVDSELLDAFGRPRHQPVALGRTTAGDVAFVAAANRYGHTGFQVVWTTLYKGAFTRVIDGRGALQGPTIALRGTGDPGGNGYLFAYAGRAGGYVSVYPPSANGISSAVLDARRFSARLRPLGLPVKLIRTEGDLIALPGSIVCSPVRPRCLAAWTTEFFPSSLPTSPGPSPRALGAQLNLDRRSLKVGTAAPIADITADPAEGSLYPALVRLGYGRLLLAWVGGNATASPGARPDYEVFTRILRVPW